MLAGGAPVRSRYFRLAAPFMAVALLGSLIPAAASPATGSLAAHRREQEGLVGDALTLT